MYRERRWRFWLGGIGVAGMLLLVTLPFCWVRGGEIDPRTWRRRNFVYGRLPGVGIQVTPVWLEPVPDSNLVAWLRRNGHLPARALPPEGSYEEAGDDLEVTGAGARWDVIWIATATRHHQGQAALLADLLEPDPFWLAWVEAHPDESDRLWKALVAAAVAGDYETIPDQIGKALDASRDRA